VGQLPNPLHDGEIRLVTAEVPRQKLPEDPVSVEIAPGRIAEIHWYEWLTKRRRSEVLAIVIDVVVDDLLHPGRGAFQEPAVLIPVVCRLNCVKELVRGRHLKRWNPIRTRELASGEVV